MSKVREVGATCGCGGQVTAMIEKPTRMEHRTEKAVCPDCKSKYIFRAYVDKDQPGRVIKLDGILLEMSEKLQVKLKEQRTNG